VASFASELAGSAKVGCSLAVRIWIIGAFLSLVASTAKVGCSLAVRTWIIGAFLFLVASTAVVGSGISHAQRDTEVEAEVKAYSMFLILSMMAYLSRE
jgi:hypothetical protein